MSGVVSTEQSTSDTSTSDIERNVSCYISIVCTAVYILYSFIITASADNSQITGTAGSLITSTIEFSDVHSTATIFLVDYHIDGTSDSSILITASKYLTDSATAYKGAGIASYIGRIGLTVTSGKYAVKSSTVYGYIRSRNRRCVSASEQILYGVAAIVYDYSSGSCRNSGQISGQVTTAIYSLKCICALSRSICTVDGYCDRTIGSSVNVIGSKHVVFYCSAVNNDLNRAVDRSSICAVTQTATIDRTHYGSFLEPNLGYVCCSIIDTSQS